MENITLLGVCALIAGVGGAISYIIKAYQPISDLKKKLESHQTYLNNDDLRLKELETGNRVIQKSLIALLDHEITGNSIDKLKKARTDLQNYLIER